MEWRGVAKSQVMLVVLQGLAIGRVAQCIITSGVNNNSNEDNDDGDDDNEVCQNLATSLHPCSCKKFDW